MLLFLVVFNCLSVTLRVGRPFARVGYNLNSYCVTIYGSNDDFHCVFTLFFKSDCPFRIARQFLLPSLGGVTIFEKFQSKIAKSPKTGGTVFAHHLAERFEENFTVVD